ncbi:MAG: hypothetical protein ACRC4M_01635 [Mycoplasma sp.]
MSKVLKFKNSLKVAGIVSGAVFLVLGTATYIITSNMKIETKTSLNDNKPSKTLYGIGVNNYFQVWVNGQTEYTSDELKAKQSKFTHEEFVVMKYRSEYEDCIKQHELSTSEQDKSILAIRIMLLEGEIKIIETNNILNILSIVSLSLFGTLFVIFLFLFIYKKAKTTDTVRELKLLRG